MNWFSSRPSFSSLNPRARRRDKYSSTALRSVLIICLPAMGERAYAGCTDRPWHKSRLSVQADASELFQFRSSMLHHGASGSQENGEAHARRWESDRRAEERDV